MIRGWLRIVLVSVAVLVAADLVVAQIRGSRPLLSIADLIAGARPPIVVGLIHSQTGPLAISEKSMIDAEVLALEEINARGGIGGRLLRWEIADGRSDPSTFANEARRMIDRDKAEVLVGGWTAECRKAMISVIEERKSLLIFPTSFEGMEVSPHVVYAGGSANQVILPAVRWFADSLHATKFFVIGTEEIASRCVSELAKDAVKASGGQVVGEVYLPLTGGDAQPVVEAIQKAKPDAVLNLLVGDSNLTFFAALKAAGLTSEKLPVLAYNLAENELKGFPPGDVTGHYAAWSYFQSLDRPENLEFIRKFKARYGQNQVISDSMVAAHNGLTIWAQAAGEAGTGDPRAVLEQLDRQSLDAPEGIVTIDPDSRAAWRPCHVGKIRSDGQFDVVWSITKPIHPVTFVTTRTQAQWLAFLDDLKTRWGGRWSAGSR